MVQEGILAAVVWPAYVGVLDRSGHEPASDPDYERGQIFWTIEPGDEIHGRATLLVPKGYYTHLVYFHHPTIKLEVGRQILSQPYDFKVPGGITVEHITKEDFTQLPTNRGYRLPVMNAGTK